MTGDRFSLRRAMNPWGIVRRYRKLRAYYAPHNGTPRAVPRWAIVRYAASSWLRWLFAGRLVQRDIARLKRELFGGEASDD